MKYDFGPNPKDFTCNGECSRCGECCTPLLPITLDEYYIIKDYIKKNKIEPTNMVRPEGIYIKCPFYDFDNKICKIYEVRPEVCRAFSCANKYRLIAKNRKYYDARADINGDHLDRFVPFDLLFYDNPIMSIIIAHAELKAKTPEEIVATLFQLGSDQEFFKKYKIPNTSEVAAAIIKKDIKFEFEKEDK